MLTNALLPAMRDAGRGRIVMVSSAGGVRGMPATAPYSAAKGALERWAESLASEIAPFGLGVTILVTGTYDTDIITDAGTTDCRDFDGPYARQHAKMDQRGRLAMKYAARSPERFAIGLAKALDGTAPFAPATGGPRRANAADHQPGTAPCWTSSDDAVDDGSPRSALCAAVLSAAQQLTRAREMADTAHGSLSSRR